MSGAALVLGWPLRRLGTIGAAAIGLFRQVSLILAMAVAVALQALRPATWRVTVRAELARQIFYSGVVTLRLLSFLAALVGLVLLFRLIRFAGDAGQLSLVRDLFVTTLIEYIGPLLVSLVVVGRSGMAIIGEIASMRVTGQINLLEAQGIDPLRYIVLPRAVGLAACVPLLTFSFTVLTLAVGYAASHFLGVARSDPLSFINNVLERLTPDVIASVAAKTVICGYAIGVIACLNGLQAGPAQTDVSRLLPRGFVQTIVAVFLVIVLVSVLI